MRRKKNVIIYTVLLTTLLGLAMFGNYFLKELDSNQQVTFVELPSTPAIDPTANQQFFEVVRIDSTYELNKGLTMERISSVALEGHPTPSVNYVALLILNHTHEAIVFEDVGFGVQVFQYDLALMEWKKMVLPYVPEKIEKTLPPKTESFDFSILNTWEFNNRDFINVDNGSIRIFVGGLGANSNKKYGAYIDLALQK